MEPDSTSADTKTKVCSGQCVYWEWAVLFGQHGASLRRRGYTGVCKLNMRCDTLHQTGEYAMAGLICHAFRIRQSE